MDWSYRKNARHRNSEKDVVRKAVCNKTKRKTKNEMAGWRVHGPEKDGSKWMERQYKGSRGLEAYCKGGQGPPRAVAPSKKIEEVCYSTVSLPATSASIRTHYQIVFNSSWSVQFNTYLYLRRKYYLFFVILCLFIMYLLWIKNCGNKKVNVC